MKDENKPEVSVVITNYNYGQYLEQAIESVLNQTYEPIQLFIIDDASSDNSHDLLKKYAKKSEVIKHRVNKGIVFARNEALDFCKTKYILFLDADDWLDANYVETLVEAAETRSLDVAYCNANYFISKRADMGESLNPAEFTIDRLKNGNYIHMSSLLNVKAVGRTRFDKGMEKITHEDWDFFLNLALKGLKFEKVSGAALNYRVKPVNRNMHLDDEIGFAKLYKYIYEKYNAENPQEIGYLAYYGFANKFLRVGEELVEARAIIEEEQGRVKLLHKRLNEISGSRSYKLGKGMLLPFRFTKRFIKKVRSVEYKRIARQAIINSKTYSIVDTNRYTKRNLQAKSETYFIKKDGVFKKTSDYAVILHLYYTSNWTELFAEKLAKLASQLPFDLYVTMPEKNIEYAGIIRREFPNASILVVPNRGRDVLPFIKTASFLKNLGYKKVLKIHSKKSLHRNHDLNTAETGEAWLENTLDSLIPEDSRVMRKLIARLKEDNTGMIGPLEYLYPLKMYLKNNRRFIERIMKGFGYDLFSENVQETLNGLTYFGGTMFWVDLDSISKTFEISKDNFQTERAQNDATVAHALERIFSILPELEGKDVYAVSVNKVTAVHPDKSGYPAWYYDDIAGGHPPISIVVPVYSDWSSLSLNIASLKKFFGNHEGISIHYVNDCGPEADDLEKKILENIRGYSNFFYHRNEKNLGFVKSCNRATFKLIDQTNDVLLLNSDTRVTKSFAYEMRHILYSEKRIGAVTSRSNNATIWSVPMTGKFAHHRLLSYTLYQAIKRDLPDKYITPTIHGFCVLIRREVLDKYGLFDEVYGKGYGEENDFAMRIRSHGWKCAVANYSYVFHYESRSFGNETRNKQIAMNEKILVERYPDYRHLVQEYWDSITEPMK